LEIPIISGFKLIPPAERPAGGGKQAGLSSPLAQVMVLSRLEGDLILLKIGQEEVVARNTAGLRPGQVVQAEVLRGQPGQADLALRLLSPPPEEGSAAGRLLPGLTQTGPLGPALNRLWGLLADPGPPGPAEVEEAIQGARQGLAKALLGPGRISPADLKAIWSSLGLDLEPRLAQAVRGEGGPENQAGLGQVLKPRLLALVRALGRLADLDQASARTKEPGQDRAAIQPGLKKAVAELEKALTRLQDGPKADPGIRLDRGLIPGLKGRAVPGQAALPNQPPPARQADLPVQGPVRARPPQPAKPLKEVQTGPVRRPSQPPAAKDPNLKELARLKGRFLRTVLSRPDLSPATGRKEAAPALPGRARAEAVRVVTSTWPRLAQALAATKGDPRPLVAALEERLSAILQAAASPERLAALSGEAQEVLRGLEGVQVTNSLAAGTETSYLLPLPFLPGGGMVSGQILYYRPPFKGAGGEGKQPLRMVFLLDLSRLGEIRVDVSLADKELMLNLYLTKPGAQRWAAGRMSGLKKTLDGLGYQVRRLSVRSLAKAPPVEELAPRPRPREGAGMIDLRA